MRLRWEGSKRCGPIKGKAREGKGTKEGKRGAKRKRRDRRRVDGCVGAWKGRWPRSKQGEQENGGYGNEVHWAVGHEQK